MDTDYIHILKNNHGFAQNMFGRGEYCGKVTLEERLVSIQKIAIYSCPGGPGYARQEKSIFRFTKAISEAILQVYK